MHAAGLWTVFSALCRPAGGSLRRPKKFDPPAVWRDGASARRSGMMTMVGDAYAAPLVEELNAPTTTCRRCTPSEPAARRPIPNTYGRCWRCCRSSRSSTAMGRRRPATWASATTSGDPSARHSTCARGAGALRRHDAVPRTRGHEVGWVVRTGRIPLGYFDDADATRKTSRLSTASAWWSRATAPRWRRRHAAAFRPRLAGGQHRRREGLRRGGRRGAARSPGRRRRTGGRPRASAGARRSSRSSRCSPARRVDTDSLHAALHSATRTVQGTQGVHLRRQGPPARQRQGRLPLGEKSMRYSEAD